MGSEDLRRGSGSHGPSPSHLKRLTPCLVFLMIILVFQFYVISTKNSTTHFIKEKLVSIVKPTSRPKPEGPLHVLLLSYARTGSSFFGDLLQSLPSSFYHFEPLHFMGGPVLNDSYDEARLLLQKLFTCNASQVPGFMGWQRSHHKNYMKLKRSLKYWKACSKLRSACYNASFIDTFCRNHSMVIVKTIRLGLREASKLFTSDLNLKIIYLVRDPRGTLNSRLKPPVKMWCARDPLCINPGRFCSSLGEEVDSACSLLKSRSEDFLVIRYEDLSMEPLATATTLVRFLGLSSIPKDMEAFLGTHTSVLGYAPQHRTNAVGVDYAYSTSRNSSVTAMKWRQELSFENLNQFQKDCMFVLPRFGYYLYNTLGALRSNVNFDMHLTDGLKTACNL